VKGAFRATGGKVLESSARRQRDRGYNAQTPAITEQATLFFCRFFFFWNANASLEAKVNFHRFLKHLV
jgi:hypothetical protein